VSRPDDISESASAEAASSRRYLPLGIDVTGMPCLVIGGGEVGTRKVLSLHEAGAAVTVLAPEITARLRILAESGSIRWIRDHYSTDRLQGFQIVVAATSDADLNIRIGREARDRNILHCITSPGRVSQIIFPATWTQNDITVAIHSDGRDCLLARDIRNALRDAMEDRKSAAAHVCVLGLLRTAETETLFRDLVDRTRKLTAIPGVAESLWIATSRRLECWHVAESPAAAARAIRRHLHEQCGIVLETCRNTIYHLQDVRPDSPSCLDEETAAQFEAARSAGLLASRPVLAGFLNQALQHKNASKAQDQTDRAPSTSDAPDTATGKVYIVGGGPGAADLITLRGIRALRCADVILCDDLLPRTFLDDLAIPLTGKRVEWLGDDARHPRQDAINARMAEAALAGQIVVRLKNGDPFVFGRGAEEIEYLAARKIPWELVPGSSSCIAGPDTAGLSLTYRQNARSFAVTSARIAGGGLVESFPRAESLVILMGAAVLQEVTQRLITDGWHADCPAAVIERATLPWERRIRGRLANIASLARQAELVSPALLVVGSAAESSEHLPAHPVILFTGLDPTQFRILGNLIHWPSLQITQDPDGYEALPGILSDLKQNRFAWVIFTNRLGVRSLLTAVESNGLDARIFAGTRISAAGTGTAALLREFGLQADETPSEMSNAGILRSLGPTRPGERVLLVQGSHTPRGLAEELTSRGWQPTSLALHRLIPHPELGRPLPQHDILYFVSPSGVRAFYAAYGPAGLAAEVWCFGEHTQKELARLGKQAQIVVPNT